MGDYTYRTREEVEEWKLRCPIRRLRETLIQEYGMDESAVDAVEAEVNSLVEAAQKSAESAPFPAADTAASHVYAEPVKARPEIPPPSKESAKDREITFMQSTLEALTDAMAVDPKSSSWAKVSVCAVETSAPRLACTKNTAQCGCATRRFANAGSSAWAAAPP